MQVIYGATDSFRARLIEMIDDQKVQRSLVGLRQSEEFIDILVQRYLDEIAKSFENQGLLRAKREKLKDLAASVLSPTDCIDLAYVLFLTQSFSDREIRKWAEDWLAKAHTQYPESSLIRFLYARVRLSPSHPASYEITENEETMENEAFEDLKKLLKTDPRSVIDAMYRLDRMMQYTFAKHGNILDQFYDKFHRKLFPEVSKTLYPSAVSSYYHATCAEYYRIAEMMEEQEYESCKALELYSENSLAIVQVAYIEANENSKKAEHMFNDALQLAKDQFIELPSTQISVRAMAHAGLGYFYSKSGLYKKAEKCYYEALLEIEYSSISQSPPLRSLRSSILLNRGRSRLDGGRLQDAKEDFVEAGKEPDLLAHVETNMGVLCYEQSFKGKAKSRFHHAIELKSDLAEAYYNLGVIYNEEGRKEKALRLFKTALNIDGNLKEAQEALDKLDGSKVEDIRDWYKWWFGGQTTRCKKALGTVFLGLILLGVSSAIYNIHMRDSDVSNSLFGVLGFALIFLVLPLITKLKLGTIEVEMESKGKRPLSDAHVLSIMSA
jgi:tetratricopeptide (TPR) repeat protein